jgi:hypothetical protein
MTDESQREIVIHAGSLRGDVVEGLKLPTVLDLEFHVAPIVADSDIEIPVDFIGAFSDDAFDSDLYGAAFANIYVLYFPVLCDVMENIVGPGFYDVVFRMGAWVCAERGVNRTKALRR